MNKSLHILWSWTAWVLLAVGFAACSSDPETEEPKPAEDEYLLKTNVESVGASSVTISLETKGLTKAAYLVTSVKQTPTIIFATGSSPAEMARLTDGKHTITINGFEPETDYTIYFAAITDKEEYYTEVSKVEFTTKSFTDEIEVFDVSYNSFKIHVNFPEQVQEGNVLKWGLADYILYNNGYTDAEKINMHDKAYGNYFSQDKTFVFDNDPKNQYVGGTEESDAYYYEPIVPNQPTYFILGEFSYVDEENMGYWYTDEDGDQIYKDYTGGFHEPGYYHALFDSEGYYAAMNSARCHWRTTPLSTRAMPDQSEFWTGYYRLVEVKTKAPELLDGEFEVNFDYLRPNGGEIQFFPTDNVYQYLFVLLDPTTLEYVKSILPDQEQSSLQWYLTTKSAYFEVGVGAASGAAALSVAENIYYLNSDTDYTLILIGMGDAEGTSQFYREYTFRLPEATKPAPAVEVTAIEKPAEEVAKSGEQTPYELWFNVKSTSEYVEVGKYAFNTVRRWESMLSYYTYEGVVDYAEQYFDLDELAKIKSPEGLNVMFQVTPESHYGFAVMLGTDEGTFGAADYVESHSLAEALPEQISSPLFESLQGDWTLSATISYTVYNNETLTYSTATDTRHTKVSIGDYALPETLPESLYEGFAKQVKKMSREEVDAAYASILEQQEVVNAKTRHQNRLLCQGYDLYPVISYLGYSKAEYCSPYTLFYGASQGQYSFYDAAALFYDAGPKWYIEIDEAGNLKVPFNALFMDPAFGYSDYYMVGINSQESEMQIIAYNPEATTPAEATAYFPVTLSADGNTLTIEPFEYEGSKYYMHCAAYSYGNYETQAVVISDIKLQRGWSDTATSSRMTPSTLNLSTKSQAQTFVRLPGDAPARATKVRSTTPFTVRELTKLKATVVTPEQFLENRTQRSDQ